MTNQLKNFIWKINNSPDTRFDIINKTFTLTTFTELSNCNTVFSEIDQSTTSPCKIRVQNTFQPKSLER